MLIKKFWDNMDFRNWKYAGDKLENPFIIIWRIMLLPFTMLSLVTLCLFLALSGNTHVAKRVWDYGCPF